MAYSKVIFNGTTLMDVTQDTVESNTLLDGETATASNGVQIVGSAQIGTGWTEETVTSGGAVITAIDPYVMYHFTGAITSLTITMNSPSTGQLAHYHFDFLSGSTAPTFTMPQSVVMPDNFTVEANKKYEVDLLNNYGAVITWTTS